MADDRQDPEIFPVDPNKTYGLMELARGTSPLVAKEPEDTVMTFPYLVIIEVLAALAVVVLLLFLSTVRDAPLEEIANPDVSPNPGKAAWYLISAQELILHMHPTVGAIMIPAVVILGLIIISYVDPARKGSGVGSAQNGESVSPSTQPWLRWSSCLPWSSLTAISAIGRRSPGSCCPRPFRPGLRGSSFPWGS